jgi:hypothetical protein
MVVARVFVSRSEKKYICGQVKGRSATDSNVLHNDM